MIKEVKVTRKGKSERMPIHFGFAAQVEFCEERGITMDEYDKRVGGDKMMLGDISWLIYFGLKAGHAKMPILRDTPFLLTHNDVCDMIDETPTLITDAFSALMSAQPKGEPGEKGEVKEG